MNPITAERTASSTFELIRVARLRGHLVSIFHPNTLSLQSGGVVLAMARSVRVSDAPFRGYVDCEAPESIDVSTCDVLLVRLQPPFDMAYFSACRILQCVEHALLTVNKPSAIISFPEKLVMMRFPELHPPTIVSSCPTALAEFRRTYNDVVIKPLYDFQGSGVFRVVADDPNYAAIIDTVIRLYSTPIVMQKYLPAVVAGDKRIFLLNGVPVAALNRIPMVGSVRANLHAGGTPEAATLSDRDMELCSSIGPELVREGLYFVGIDVIDGFITEISTTSPTGLVQARELCGTDVAHALLEAVERQALLLPSSPDS